MEVSDDATDVTATETGVTVDTASDANTTADDSSDSNWSPTTCPSCGTGVLMEVVMGPSEAHLSPCGCRVAPGFLQRRRD